MSAADTYWDMFFGYGALWILLSIYILRLQYEQRQLRRELDALKALASEAGQNVDDLRQNAL